MILINGSHCFHDGHRERYMLLKTQSGASFNQRGFNLGFMSVESPKKPCWICDEQTDKSHLA